MQPREPMFYEIADNKYVRMTNTPTLYDGYVVSLVFMARPFAMSDSMYGISYGLDERGIIVYDAGQVGNHVCIDAVEEKHKPYVFRTVSKNSRHYINVLDNKGHRLAFRVGGNVKYSDLVDGTLNKFSGVARSTAKLSATLADTQAFTADFDYSPAKRKQGSQNICKITVVDLCTSLCKMRREYPQAFRYLLAHAIIQEGISSGEPPPPPMHTHTHTITRAANSGRATPQLTHPPSDLAPLPIFWYHVTPHTHTPSRPNHSPRRVDDLLRGAVETRHVADNCDQWRKTGRRHKMGYFF